MSQSVNTLNQTPYTVNTDSVPQPFIDHIMRTYPVGSGSWLTGIVERYVFDRTGVVVIKREGNGREVTARYPMSARWETATC